jgi:membrane-bound lytic murein transglycosylase A
MKLRLIEALALFVLILAPLLAQADRPVRFETPTKKIIQSEWPLLTDDLDFEGLDIAIDRQLKRYRQIDLSGKIILGGDAYNLTIVKKSLQKLLSLVGSYKKCRVSSSAGCIEKFNYELQQRFNMYVPDLKLQDPRYGEDKSTLFTGYYTPLIRASTTQSQDYPYPIFRKPRDKNKASASRVEIDFRNALSGHGYELYFAKNLFDLYLMHVQGGGHVVLDNKGKITSRYLSYDGTNGQSWNFISKYMREKNMITDGSIYSQRDYLNENPHRQEEIYATCPSYVYFKNSTTPPEGSDRVALTDNRSLATDINHYKFKGMIAFVNASRPIENQIPDSRHGEIIFKPFSRFFLDQDTGGAIRGKARVDLYFGEGEYAELAAYNTVQRGDIYFLILKQ